MIRIHSQTQLTLEGFETPFERSMDKNNRWVKLSACIPMLGTDLSKILSSKRSYLGLPA